MRNELFDQNILLAVTPKEKAWITLKYLLFSFSIIKNKVGTLAKIQTTINKRN